MVGRMTFLLEPDLFSGAFAVSFREVTKWTCKFSAWHGVTKNPAFPPPKPVGSIVLLQLVGQCIHLEAYRTC